MIQLHNISLAFGGQQVLDGITWTVKPGQRIGLIGPNGAGKSTLLRLISGKYQPDAGTVSRGGGTTVGFLAQDTQEMDSGRTVLEEAMQAFSDVLALQAEEAQITEALADAGDHEREDYHRLLHALERVHTTLVTREAHLMQPRTEAILTGLGFEPDDLERPLNTFSGGWRMRVALARLLLVQPGVLLLDEPTNHLDIDSIDWLEGYLKGYPGTVVIVSHDRYFLDRMVTTIAELVRGQITVYAGNYTFYLNERTERRALQQAAYENQQRQITETERFIERFRYKATKARQVQSRVKMLEKMARILPPPNEEATITFRFPEPPRSGRVVLELSAFSKTYPGEEGDVEVFHDAGPITIERGDKIALIGKNGAGKSTLVRILNGNEDFEGTRTLGYQVMHTYFAQHQAEALDPRSTVLEALAEQARGQTEPQLRGLLGAFLFQGDDVFKPVSVLSGGEKSRVALARALLSPANLLLLDEPTNHLDIQSINVLIEALRQYSGSFVIVSHDRHFLDQVVTKVWRVGSGQVSTFFGNYSDYQWQLEHGTASRLAQPTNGRAEQAEDKAAPAEASAGPKTKAQKRREAEERQRRYDRMQQKGKADYGLLNDYQLQNAYRDAEEVILKKEEQQARLEAALADPEVYQDARLFQSHLREYDAVQAELAGLYEKWEALAEAMAARKEA